MTPAEERAMYENDHVAWCAYAAPRWRSMLLACKSPDEKKALWEKASDDLKAAVRALREPERLAA